MVIASRESPVRGAGFPALIISSYGEEARIITTQEGGRKAARSPDKAPGVFFCPRRSAMSTLPLTEGNLKTAMTDPRYTNSRHPEYKSWRDMVSKGFATLYPDDALRGDHTDQLDRHQGADGHIYASDGTKVADGTIRVRSYTRTVNGQVVEVAAHERSGGSSPGTMRGLLNSRIPVASSGGSAIGDRQEITPAMKERFADEHLADAQKVADRLNVPVENILGLSALEGGWGINGRFAAEGNNYFGLHYNKDDPHASGYLLTTDGAVKVAKYPDYAASANAFADKFGHLVQGVQDPREFAKRLQNAGLFGINRDGSKVPSYVGGVAGTITGFKNRLARRRGAS
ncbi:hypothetical protein CCC_01141 [Paramagnetospirillum magnetotacticum MS-1]|uniref:Mannosyl-glycoprotein endo-beta-N-acetylglucosamidase-like domain-containing protein n=2 Tax=Paramagnetospirillum magnetotacticum TaxID=188 RepID=A0A0C2YTR2_PARME|nr:hypothetical protein CCC_01141 [Paramagnetospirillum magnetotacticum MS-1]